jgi:hypothetical protein
MSRSMSRAVVASGLVLMLGGVAAAQASLKVGEKAPDYTLQGDQLWGDGRAELKEFRGNVLMLDFWGNR